MTIRMGSQLRLGRCGNAWFIDEARRRLGWGRKWFFAGHDADGEWLFEDGRGISRDRDLAGEARRLRRLLAIGIHMARVDRRIRQISGAKAVHGRTVQGIASWAPDILACSSHDPLWQDNCREWGRLRAARERLGREWAAETRRVFP